MSLVKVINTGEPYPEWLTITGTTHIREGGLTESEAEEYLCRMRAQFYQSRRMIARQNIIDKIKRLCKY